MMEQHGCCLFLLLVLLGQQLTHALVIVRLTAHVRATSKA